jgi:phosphate transport system permease protein
VASSTLLLVVVGLALLGYYAGRQRAVAAAVAAGPRSFHSLPGYHGGFVALWCALPALALLALWHMFEPIWLRSSVLDSLPETMQSLPESQLGLIYNDIRNLVEGNVAAAAPNTEVAAAAEHYIELRTRSRMMASAAVIVLGIVVLGWAYRRVRPEFRARNRVEGAIELLLIAASCVAILTTIGIFLSVFV